MWGTDFQGEQHLINSLIWIVNNKQMESRYCLNNTNSLDSGVSLIFIMNSWCTPMPNGAGKHMCAFHMHKDICSTVQLSLLSSFPIILRKNFKLLSILKHILVKFVNIFLRWTFNKHGLFYSGRFLVALFWTRRIYWVAQPKACKKTVRWRINRSVVTFL